jgi:hypothetical protein
VGVQDGLGAVGDLELGVYGREVVGTLGFHLAADPSKPQKKCAGQEERT